MSTVAVGDIHGNIDALDDLLSRLLPSMRPEDTLVFLGDLIDRGPDSRGVMERLVRLREDAAFETVFLLGNHELWMLDSLRDATKHHWAISCSAFATIASYAPDFAVDLRRRFGEIGPRLFEETIAMPYERFFERLPKSHLALFEDMRYFHRSDDVTCVHGGVRLDGSPPTEDDGGHLVWGPLDFPEEYRGDARVCYGHHDDAVEDPDGWPHPRVLKGRTFGIDTISRGVLTAMRFPELALVQSARYLAT
jgi:serine/threonine protein phosphatase 1